LLLTFDVSYEVFTPRSLIAQISDQSLEKNSKYAALPGKYVLQ
jgi:hypothetical protein